MKQYFKTTWQAIKNSLSYLLMYRADFILKIFLGIGWAIVGLLIVELIFSHTSSFNGWDKAGVILLYITLEFSTMINGALAGHITKLEEHIRIGTFDGIITKPIDSQFLSTFIRPDMTDLIFTISYLCPFIYLLFKNNADIVWIYLPLYIIFILLANAIFLFLRTMAATLNFWFIKLNNIAQLLEAVRDVSHFPITLYPKKMQIAFYTVLPIAFLAFVPAEILLGKISIKTMILGVIITIFFYTASRLLWKKAIKNYSSASS